jgi:hypothetical protein
MTDPFADYDQTPAAEPAKEQADTRPSATTVSTPETSEVSVTLKGGSGFDAPWVVVRAGSIPSILAQLKNYAPELTEVFDTALKYGGYFARNGAQKPAGGSAQPGPNGVPATEKPAYQQAPGGQQKFCDHGEMTFRSGVGKASGKAYKGFFCPSPNRDEQCDAQFLR